MASHVVSLVCYLFPVLWDAILGFPQVVDNPEFRWIEQGDINFGAILSIHSTDSLFSCTDTIQDVRNIQTVEALNFAVKEINDRQDILQNLTLGFYILDDCLSTPLALARAIQFMPRDIREARPVQDNVSGIPIGPNGDVHFYDVFGVIGAYTSKLSMVVANVLNIFSLPQISYSATSNALSDKSRFPYFFRMVPPDFYQVRTIASLLRMFNWTHVSTVFSEGTYGRDGVKVLEHVFHKMGNDICIEQKIEISYGSEKQDFRTVLDKLAGKINTPVVVAFLEIGDVKMLVESIREAGMAGRFVWVGSDSLNLILEESPERCNIFPGSISVRPHSSQNDKLKDHLRLLFDKKENQNNTRNPWINELLTRGHAFHGDEDHEICLLSHQGEHLRPRFIDMLIIDSVYAFAHALDKTIKRVCPDYLLNSLDISKCVSRTAVYNELKTLTFNGPSGVVAFNKDGDVMTKYEIFQCQENVLKSEVKSIGSWFMENESLQMELERVLWKQNKFPISACPKPCTEMTGSIYYFTKQTCCHVCVGCKVNEIATTNATRCEICPEMYWPDDSRSTCIKIPPFFFGLQNPIAITLVSIAVVGGIFCLFITCVLFTYRNEHVVKCFSLELSGIILAGTAVAFCLTGVLVSEPSTVKCFISHVGFSFTFTVIYAPLLIKTNRIYRIFNAGKRTTKRPRFISNSSQVIMAAILISLQAGIVVISTSIEPPEVILHMPRLTDRFVELFCNVPRVGLLTSLSYNLVLVVLCIFYAFRTRTLPDNYKESRYIAFCVNTTLLIWITFIPTYFTTTRAAAKTTILAVSLLLNAYVTLIFLFIPRVHTLYYSLKEKRSDKVRDHKNVRIVKHVVIRNGPVDERPNYSASDSSRRLSASRELTDDVMNMNDLSDVDFDFFKYKQNVNNK